MAFIGCGTWSKYYIYIFLLVLCRFICDYLEGFNQKEYYNKPDKESFIEFGSIFSYHPLFRDFMYFLGAIIVGVILYIIFLKNEEDKDSRKLSLKKFTIIKRTLLGIDDGTNIYIILIIASIYSANIMIRTFLMSLKFDAGFWTLEILFVIFLSIKILKIKFGNHQKVTIFILSIILFSVQIVNSFLMMTDHNCKEKECEKEYITDNNMWIFMYKKFGNVGWIIFILLLYISDFIMRDYSWVRLKYLLDAKSVPTFKVMLFIGIAGCVLVIICLSIVTNVPCNYLENIIKIKVDNEYKYQYEDTDNFVEFEYQLCGVTLYDEKSKKLTFYYDNFFIFISDYTNSTREGLEIFILVFYFIINVTINFTHAMILKHLDPNAMLVNINFNYFLSRLITYIMNKGSKEFMTVELFILLELCEVLAIIAYMIYIELIELKFCKLDYHLKKNIELRSEEEVSMNKEILLKEVEYDDDPNEQNKNNNKKEDEAFDDSFDIPIKKKK